MIHYHTNFVLDKITNICTLACGATYHRSVVLIHMTFMKNDVTCKNCLEYLSVKEIIE